MKKILVKLLQKLEDNQVTFGDDTLFNGSIGISDSAYRRREIKSKTLDRLVLPDLGDRLNDRWELVHFNNLLKTLIEDLESERFSICSVSDLVAFYDPINKFKYHDLKEYRDLHKIHCVRYSELPHSVLADIIPYINSIFSKITVIEAKGAFIKETLRIDK